MMGKDWIFFQLLKTKNNDTLKEGEKVQQKYISTVPVWTMKYKNMMKNIHNQHIIYWLPFLKRRAISQFKSKITY